VIPTNKTNSSLSRPHGIAVSSSVIDTAIPYAGALTQLALKLTWYNGWRGGSSDVNPRLMNVTGGSAKKKSGKKSSTTYYSAAVDCVLGLPTIRGILSAWYNNQKFDCAIVGASGVIGTATDGSGNGVFSWTPSGVDSVTTYTGAVPSSGPYQVTVPNFVADINRVVVNGRYLNPADPGFPPGAGQYTVTTAGLYTFNVAQAGGTLSIKYRELSSGGSAILAGVVAAVIHEPFTASFNDYGAPGPVSVAGTWENPCWNAGYPVPGRIDAGAYRARDPYSYWQAITGATVYFPAALIGKPVTVYYAVPQILKSDGSFYSATITPLQLLGGELEPQCGEGAEYAAFTAQQIINAFCSGVGFTNMDLGASNAMPNVLLEAIGAFTLFANGDGEVADFIEDLVKSGPNLLPAEVGALYPTAVSSVNEGDSGPPNYGDQNVQLANPDGTPNAKGSIWVEHSAGLDEAHWKITWSGFGASAAAHAYLNYNLDWANSDRVPYMAFSAQDGAGHSATLSVGDSQSLDISGWDLASLSVSIELADSLLETHIPAAMITLSELSVTTLSSAMTLNPVGHGCNLNDYTGTPVPGQGNVLGDLTALRNFCRAYGISVSPKLDSQRAAKDILDELLLIANTAAVYSGKLLNFIPRCEISAAKNGATYTAPAPVFALDDDDLISDGKTPHIKFQRPRRAGCDNVYSVEFTDRTIDYGDNVVSDVDQRSIALYGPRKGGALDTAIMGQRPASGSQSMKSISDPAVAQLVANVQARRSAAGLPPIIFEMTAENGHIESMDIGTIASKSLGIPAMSIRMKSAKETSKRTWQCEAEPYIAGLNQPRQKSTVAATGSLQTGNVGVSGVNAPIIFEPPPAMVDGGSLGIRQIWFLVSDSDSHYGGCAVMMSDDGGASYNQVGMMGPCSTGVLTADYPTHVAGQDSADTLALDLSESNGSIASQAALAALGGAEACYIAGASGTFEIVSPIAVTPGTAHTFSCSSAARGVFGSTPEDHPSGSRFGVTAGAFKLSYPSNYVGQTLYFKFPALNNVGGQQQDLSTCTAYPYTPVGTSSAGSLFQVNGA
jgi:hypothetical protein